MEFSFEAKVILKLDYKKGATKSDHVATEFNLELSPNLDKKQYFGEDELPNKKGSETLTNCFVQGLVANIHNSHQQGFRDSAEHLRYIIAELERGFITPAEVFKGEFSKL